MEARAALVLAASIVIWCAGACSVDRSPTVDDSIELDASNRDDDDNGSDERSDSTMPDAAAADGGGEMDAALDDEDAGDAMEGDAAMDGSPGDGGVDDGGKPDDEPEQSFGLKCGDTLCAGVTMPAQQCCSSDQDVEAARALQPEQCGIARVGVAGCYELEQPGVPDDSCPAVAPNERSEVEPGCCTPSGACGTLNVDDGVGCHLNEEVDQACGEEVDTETTCEGTGIYAVKASIDVAWGGQSTALFDITDDGRGRIEIYLRARIDAVADDDSFVSTVKVCGAKLPPIAASLLCEAYQPTFPDAIWDHGNVPEVEAKGRFACRNPGCQLIFEPTTAAVGITLDDTEAQWPMADETLDLTCPAGQGRECFPDQDNDGYPGLTVVLPEGETLPGRPGCRRGYPLSGAPLNANIWAILRGVVRTDRLHLGVRVRLGVSGLLNEECGVGDAAGVGEYVQSRMASCLRKEGTHNPSSDPAGPEDSCSASERQFMDQNLPVYDILRLGDVPDSELELDDTSESTGARFQLQRVGDLDDEIDCAQIRATF